MIAVPFGRPDLFRSPSIGGGSLPSGKATTPLTTVLSSTPGTALDASSPILGAASAQFDDLTNVSGLGAPAILRGFVSAARAVSGMGSIVGAGQSGSVRTATTAALNAAISKAISLGKFLEIEPGVYETNGSLLVPGGTNGFSMHGDLRSQIINYGIGSPILTIGDLTGAAQVVNCKIAGLTLQYGVSQGGAANCNGISMGPTYTSALEDIQIGTATAGALVNAPTYGIRCYSTGSGFMFQNRFRRLQINGATATFFSKELGGTGDVHEDIYMHNGSGASSANALTSYGLQLGNGSIQRSDDVWIRTNLEWLGETQAVLLAWNMTNMTFIGTHFEGCVLSGTGSPRLIWVLGGEVHFMGTEILDMKTSSGTTGATIVTVAGYSEQVKMDNTIIKFSSGSEAITPVQLISGANNNGNDTQPVVSIKHLTMNDNGSGNAAEFTLDPVIASPPMSILGQFREFYSDQLLSRTAGAQFTMLASLTLYGQHEDATIFVPASLAAAATLTLSNKRKPSGTGSSLAPKAGAVVRVRRQSGTYANALTVVDAASGNTLSTNAAAAADLVFTFNGTNWALAA